MRDGTTAGAGKLRHHRHRAIAKKVNTSRASRRKGSTADTGSSGGRRPSVGKCCLIRAGGLVTRISDDKEPQFHINRKYHHQPVIEKDTVNCVETMWPNGYGPEWNRKNYNNPTPNYPDSVMRCCHLGLFGLLRKKRNGQLWASHMVFNAMIRHRL